MTDAAGEFWLSSQGHNVGMVRRSLLSGLFLVAALLSLTGCSSASSGSPGLGKIICPTGDKYSCYYSKTSNPVHGPKTYAGEKVVGVLPKRCAVSTNCQLVGYTANYHAVCPPSCPGAIPAEEYEVWRIGGTVESGEYVAVYSTNVPKMDQHATQPSPPSGSPKP